MITKSKLNKCINHAANSLEVLTKRLDEFAEQKQRKTKQTKTERQYRGVLRHISKYGQNTILHHFGLWDETEAFQPEACVHQNLVGKEFDCECKEYVKAVKKNHDYECRHIRKVKEDPKNEAEIAYGQGAREAHRRLTTLAQNALDTYIVITPGGNLSSFNQDFPKGMTKAQALKFVGSKEFGIGYKMVKSSERYQYE